jgi:hypothetical protein
MRQKKGGAPPIKRARRAKLRLRGKSDTNLESVQAELLWHALAVEHKNHFHAVSVEREALWFALAELLEHRRLILESVQRIDRNVGALVARALLKGLSRS